MKFIVYFIMVSLFIFSCTQQKTQSTKLDKAWLHAIIKHSDSSYTKPYFRTDFVTAEYYLNKKDSVVCQLMKDSAGNIVQILIAKKDLRTFFGQYHTNGQLKALLPLDRMGQYHGDAVSFYKDSTVESRGAYEHGLKSGRWKNYDGKGTLTSIEEFNTEGQLIKTIDQ